MSAWGYIRGTDDMDIVPDPKPENLERLAMLLENLDGRVVVGEGLLARSAIGIFLRAGDKTLVRTELGEVDVLQGLPTVPRYEELERGAISVEYEGTTVMVCSLADLRAMKRSADRGIDRDDLDGLEIAHPE